MLAIYWQAKLSNFLPVDSIKSFSESVIWINSQLHFNHLFAHHSKSHTFLQSTIYKHTQYRTKRYPKITMQGVCLGGGRHCDLLLMRDSMKMKCIFFLPSTVFLCKIDLQQRETRKAISWERESQVKDKLSPTKNCLAKSAT